MIETIEEVLHHGLYDTISMLPFLMAAFLLIESLEHYSGNIIGRTIEKSGKAGPVIGAVAGCFPQCGFSVMAANLYAGGAITLGTLVATFLATSDEAILIMIGNSGQAEEIVMLLLVKVVIGIVAGYIVDICFYRKKTFSKVSGSLCGKCGCHEHNVGIIKPAINHTLRIFVYLFLFTVGLNLIIEIIGMGRLSVILLNDTIFQPVIAALIGLIPNCAASVVLTKLYLSGAITFASTVSGLCTGAGAGLIVLFKVNKSRIENLKITGILFLSATIAGIVLEILSVL